MNSKHSVQLAIDYMEEHLTEPLELQCIADKAYMSVPNLYRSFYALAGHPIKEYIRKRRLSIAARHLRHSDKPVVDIAFECGFDSYQTFTKTFKKTVGMTPGTYRKSDIYYTFETVNVYERLSYLEEKELSERYPDVSVLRLSPVRVAVYRHRSSRKEGIEREALQTVFSGLRGLGWDTERIRLFGSDVELPAGEYPYGYDLMIPLSESCEIPGLDLFRLGTLDGGLYATYTVSYTDDARIISAWDRLLAEWLPRSVFELGDHPYIEQYLTYQGAVTRMKLYLPVRRRSEPVVLEPVFVAPFTVYSCRESGPRAREEADRRMTQWLARHVPAERSEMKLFMTYSYGTEPDDDYWFELGVSVPAGHRAPAEVGEVSGISSIRPRLLGGGLYVSLTTGAYGLLTGVLDLIHRWLYTNGTYTFDDSRPWFAEYLPGAAADGADLDRSTSVTCYLPIMEVKGD